MKKSTIFLCAFFSLLIPQMNAKPFVTIWDTQKHSETNEKTIRIPIKGGEYTIQWEELNNPKNKGTATANYYFDLVFPKPGIYKVSISGKYNRIEFNNKGDKYKLIEIEQWGDAQWISFANAFDGCYNLICSAIDAPNLGKVADLSYMFQGAGSFNGTIGNWNTSKITNMKFMFRLAKVFNQPIGNWDVGAVTDMEEMFCQTDEFDQPIGNWNTANVTNMKGMFFLAGKFNQPIGNWKTKNVTTMRTMFKHAVKFNQPIENWDVSSVVDMSDMFQYSLEFNQPLNKWNTQNVINMEGMFFNSKKFNRNLNSWNVSNVTKMGFMFWGAPDFNQYLGDWDISSVLDFKKMFGFTTYKNTENYKKTVEKWLTVIPKNGQNFKELFSNGRLYE